MFEGIDLTKLFDEEGDYSNSHTFGELTDEMIARAEENIGHKLPKSYIELLRSRNGGCLHEDLFESWLSVIYGIGETAETENGLEDMFSNWIDEWQYPDIGIPFGETQSAGHDMYFMDCRNIADGEEPPIVLIDNECDNEITPVADNLEEFLKLVFAGEV